MFEYLFDLVQEQFYYFDLDSKIKITSIEWPEWILDLQMIRGISDNNGNR